MKNQSETQGNILVYQADILTGVSGTDSKETNSLVDQAEKATLRKHTH